MPRRVVDPAVGVIEYFQTAELGKAETTLAIAAGVVKQRKPAVVVKKKTDRRIEPKVQTPATVGG